MNCKKRLEKQDQHFQISRMSAVNYVKWQYFVIQAQSDENAYVPLRKLFLV